MPIHPTHRRKREERQKHKVSYKKWLKKMRKRGIKIATDVQE
jgi:hypothetical protein